MRLFQSYNMAKLDTIRGEQMHSQRIESEQPNGLASLQSALGEARRQAEESRESYLRILADQENYRKRLERVYQDRMEERQRAFLRRLLSVADSLQRALAYADDADPLSRGVKLTYDELQNVLAQEGVEPVQSLGQEFDPQIHEAVEIIADGGQHDTVESEFSKGYRYQGKLLRPAAVRVRVASR